MLNKKLLFSVGALISFAGCNAIDLNGRDITREFLTKTNDVLAGALKREKLDFKVGGNQGAEEYFLMTKEQWTAFNKLIEFAVARPRIVQEEENLENIYFDFTHNLGFERGNHYCGIKKPSWIEKIKKCVTTKSLKPLMSDSFIHTKGDYTHVALKCSVKINPFNVNTVKSRLYPLVPEGSARGNLPGVYLLGNGKTGKTGDLVGITYRAEKNGQGYDYFCGKLLTRYEV